MSALQAQAIKSIINMPDEKISILLDTIHNLIMPTGTEQISEDIMADCENEKSGIKLGLFNGLHYIAEGHDIDECNDEIAKLFGVVDFYYFTDNIYCFYNVAVVIWIKVRFLVEIDK